MKRKLKHNANPARKPLLNRHVQYELAMFLQHYQPSKFNSEFRDVLIDFIINRGDRNVRINHKFAIEGLWDLLRVLDVAADNWHWRDTDEIIEQYNRPVKMVSREQ